MVYRPRLYKHKKKKCRFCGEYFLDKSHSPTRKYCSKRCQIKRNKIVQGELREIRKEDPNTCNNCGKENTNLEYKYCIMCRLSSREYQRRYNGKRN